MTDAFTVESDSRGDTTTLRLQGELDLATAAQLLRAADDSLGTAPTLVVDLSRLQFLDSSGLRALLVIRDRCVGASMAMRLIPGPENVNRVFRVSGVEKFFEFSNRPVEP